MRFGCSCANSNPPSDVPTMPSALSVPCHAIVHVDPAATTPAISLTVTSLTPWGDPPPRCANTSRVSARNATKTAHVVSRIDAALLVDDGLCDEIFEVATDLRI